ncbi:sigma-70 family RNA polymerase sigma factor [Actinosynnema sp. NPDC023587]|uniref:RNA polymerase sigma factor n=1 Tax=Actinosynnema sp. NPDC023587 TaxID=3154695 RepID=UPI0033CE088F
MGEDNASLLAAAARGDQTAWHKLVARYEALLWSIARGFRPGGADRADVVQNTWLKLVENLDRVADPDRPAGWPATTARRECLRLLRRTERRGEADGPPPDLPADAPAVDEGLLVAERDRALRRAVERLSGKCRELIRVLTFERGDVALDVQVDTDLRVRVTGDDGRTVVTRWFAA